VLLLPTSKIILLIVIEKNQQLNADPLLVYGLVNYTVSRTDHQYRVLNRRFVSNEMAGIWKGTVIT
jgi:hypothetical protein